MTKTFRERLTDNANDFDQIVSEILAENETLNDAIIEDKIFTELLKQKDALIAELVLALQSCTDIDIGEQVFDTEMVEASLAKVKAIKETA